MIHRSICLTGLLLASNLLAGNNWPQFRGPNGSGIAENENIPAKFGPGTNELFSVEVASGASSPCIWGDHLFLTAFDEGKLRTLCLNRTSGKILWSKEAPTEQIEQYQPMAGSPAASTPATDGERVYAYFGSCGLFAYDFSGKELWSLKMPVAKHVGDFGTGTSPIVNNGIVFVNRDLLDGSHVIAVNAKTGEQLWRRERPEALSSYSTPVIWEHDGAKELVIAGSQRMKSYDARTGADIWETGGLPTATCPTPVLGEGMLYFAGWAPNTREMKFPTFDEHLKKMDGNKNGKLDRKESAGDGFLTSLFTFWDKNNDGEISKEEYDDRVKLLFKSENAAFALKPGKGELGPEKFAWKQIRGLPYVPSPLYYKGNVYLVKDGGMVTCYDAKTGTAKYEQERLGQSGTYYSSPVAVDDKIIITSLNGKITVIKAGDKPEILWETNLNDRAATTPAIVNNTLYYRTGKRLWAFKEAGEGNSK